MIPLQYSENQFLATLQELLSPATLSLLVLPIITVATYNIGFLQVSVSLPDPNWTEICAN